MPAALVLADEYVFPQAMLTISRQWILTCLVCGAILIIEAILLLGAGREGLRSPRHWDILVVIVVLAAATALAVGLRDWLAHNDYAAHLDRYAPGSPLIAPALGWLETSGQLILLVMGFLVLAGIVAAFNRGK